MEVSKINFEKEGLNSLVGGLEADILSCLWQGAEKKNCRQVYNSVKRKNRIAYTTISVTLDRMHARGLVERDIEKGKGGLKYNYYAGLSKEELANKLSKKFVGFLKRTFGEASIAYLKKNI
ncbi:MAG TPA: BlaI/MecI/CopY family transcriptional regulator [Candidatus Diapherotrites archaeon]|uniref:BlaI/MecI/CopY family transcriptional regulator n=1 Tax=Candidatus Iainarchaeum sp. TaxID=3101447 RepID=A0A7J4K2G6_9ARCH|nr:BlaI/MecI/CopY family transcriptional regulator [Candidatus Diapherotrites archaeon]